MSKTLGLYLMNERGLSVLEALVREVDPNAIECVIGARDSGNLRDCYNEIRLLCDQRGVRFVDRSERPALQSEMVFAVGWRWLLPTDRTVIVFHDSLLPRYRGFAPLVSQLVNGEREIGVTALLASAEFDKGDIVSQRSIPIEYPTRISEAIHRLCPLYCELAVDVATRYIRGQNLPLVRQDETRATYSLWRDEKDYLIDWKSKSEDIVRFIDSVSEPYFGASSFLEGKKVRVLRASSVCDLKIENRTPGKILFLEKGYPIVVCGSGMIRIEELVEDGSRVPLIPVKKLRGRFES